jgi:hypothetical protein
MTTLATQNPQQPLPQVNFSWSPLGAALAFTLGGDSYPPAGSRFEAFYTPVNQLITFVASVVSSLPIIEYRWDLGDGVIKYGSTVGHTYNVPNQSLMAKLEVTDNLNRKAYTSKVLLLQVQFATVTAGDLRVASS